MDELPWEMHHAWKMQHNSHWCWNGWRGTNCCASWACGSVSPFLECHSVWSRYCDTEQQAWKLMWFMSCHLLKHAQILLHPLLMVHLLKQFIHKRHATCINKGYLIIWLSLYWGTSAKLDWNLCPSPEFLSLTSAYHRDCYNKIRFKMICSSLNCSPHTVTSFMVVWHFLTQKIV